MKLKSIQLAISLTCTLNLFLNQFNLKCGNVQQTLNLATKGNKCGAIKDEDK